MCHTSNPRQRRLQEDSKNNAPTQQLLLFDSLVRKNPIGCELQLTEIKAKHFTTHERLLHVKSKFEDIVIHTHKQATQKFARFQNLCLVHTASHTQVQLHRKVASLALHQLLGPPRLLGPFLNNLGSTVTKFISIFDDKFMHPNYVTTSIRRTIKAFYDII
jgi:hypothetical protein